MRKAFYANTSLSNFYIHMQCFQKLSFKIDHEVQHLLKSLEKK